MEEIRKKIRNLNTIVVWVNRYDYARGDVKAILLGGSLDFEMDENINALALYDFISHHDFRLVDLVEVKEVDRIRIEFDKNNGNIHYLLNEGHVSYEELLTLFREKNLDESKLKDVDCTFYIYTI